MTGERLDSSGRRTSARWISTLGTILLLMAMPLFRVSTASASSVTSASFSGGAGTVVAGGTLYAKQGGALTLNVTTSSDTKCVTVTGAFSTQQTSGTAKSSWTFSFTAGSGDGAQIVTVSARPTFNGNNCTGQQGTATASFVLDNTGPQVSGTLVPVPNGAGWNNSNVSINWSAVDAGSGVASGPTPSSDSVTSNTSGVTRTATALDRLGNSGNGSVTVKLDKDAPTITAQQSPAPNSHGWNNTNVTVSFSCADALSGIKKCPGAVNVTANGAGQSASGTAVDNADNSASATVSGINIDKAPPTLSGAPTTSPNGAGWYNSNVTIHWTCADAFSGIDGSCPAGSTISSEGTGLTATTSVSDLAGNTTTATSSPAVNIDKTPPNTTATAPANWNNTDVTVNLNASDALSGVAATYYILDGGAQQSGTSLTITSEGTHTLQFWSVDNAGNTEATKSVTIKIDKTPPTINHTQAPPANGNGWNNSDVTVIFTCGDPPNASNNTAGSGIATCDGAAGTTGSTTVSTEGQNQSVTGTALDNAGNTATDPATVSIDKTPPSVSASADRAANGNGWYNADVTVSFLCGDALSGIAVCPDPQTLGEGANQTVNGTAIDAADNTASATLTGVNVDKTPPTIGGAPTTSANGGGWYNGDVTVHWTCADALSGIDGSCPADYTFTGGVEGNNLSTSASVADLAGNTASATVSGIQIDRTAPTTLASVPAPFPIGWYAGPVQVTLTASDSLSGVAATYYSIDGGPAQNYTGPFSDNLAGIHTITFWSVDSAGNTEDATAPGHTITLKIDNTPPTISGSAAPPANANGWNNGAVTVSFVCADADSGLASCTAPVILSNEGAGQSVTGQAVDNVGNTASATVNNINIDLTPPTLSGVPTTPANGFGWYNHDVTVQWVGQDGLSGVDPSTQPTNSIITGEGSNLGAGPVSIADLAGNSTSASVSGIKIDRSAPTISGAPTTNPNGAGWYKSAVTVHFTCVDPALADSTPGSGVANCSDDRMLSSDGANQSVTSDQPTDRAGNTGAAATVTGINIDSQPPQTGASIQCTGKNGYCRGSSATVMLSAADQAGLSGVREIHYSTDGGQSWQVVSGNTASVPIPLSGSGHATVLFFAVDNADNHEAQESATVNYDTIAPTITHAVIPAPNANGWNNTNLTAHFTASDDAGGSGIDPSSVQCGPGSSSTGALSGPDGSGNYACDVSWSTETAGQAINAQAVDLAGNGNTDSVTVKLDKTPPTISGAATTSPNANGWYNGPVTIHYVCGDALSGIAVCPSNDVLSASGANQSVSETAYDRAGNSVSTTVSGINIDTVKPAVTIGGVANGGIYTLGTVPTATCSASDSLSGLAGPCTITVSGGLPNGVGTFTFTATATDLAGNTQTVTGTYRVIYKFSGFLQPVNDTGRPAACGSPCTVSVFKGGSTIPVKFQLMRADGSIVQANSLPLWLTPQKGAATTLGVDENVYSDTATSGTTYRWDSTAQQYIYNASTKGMATGYFWRFYAQLDDGQTYYVDVALR